MSGAAAYAAQLEAIWKNSTANRDALSHRGGGGKGGKGGDKGDKGKKEDDKPQGKFETCKNSTRLNHAFMKCVKRQFIMQCPDWQQTDGCTTLMNFAKSCPVYPMCTKPGDPKPDNEKKADEKKADNKKGSNDKKKG